MTLETGGKGRFLNAFGMTPQLDDQNGIKTIAPKKTSKRN
jgi:hypothetical protein